MLNAASLVTNALGGATPLAGGVGFSQAMQFGWGSAALSPTATGVGQALTTQAIANQWQSQFNQSLAPQASAQVGTTQPLQGHAAKHITVQGVGSATAGSANVGQIAQQFGSHLSQQINHLNTLQTEADHLTQDYAAGKEVALHQVMIAMNKADMSMQLATQVRNKVLGAYQEISRMPL